MSLEQQVTNISNVQGAAAVDAPGIVLVCRFGQNVFVEHQPEHQTAGAEIFTAGRMLRIAAASSLSPCVATCSRISSGKAAA
jgi:hypothetical protein